MRLSLLFALVLSGSVFAAEPSKSSTSDDPEQLRTEYAAALTAQRAKMVTDQKAAEKRIETATAQCKQARADYETAKPKLEEVEAELSVSPKTSAPVSSLNTDYRTKLSTLKATLEQKMTAAKSLASKSGADLVKANNDLESVIRDIAILDEEAHRVACAAKNPPDDCPALGSLLGSSFPSRPARSRDASLLPLEFNDCFPENVMRQLTVEAFGSAPRDPQTPPPPFPVELYPLSEEE